MDKREFVQRFVAENYDSRDNVYAQIEVALSVFAAIEESLNKPSTTNLWDYNDK